MNDAVDNWPLILNFPERRSAADVTVREGGEKGVRARTERWVAGALCVASVWDKRALKEDKLNV